MTCCSQLFLLGQDPRCAARSQAAVRLAKTLDCHLVGVAPTGLIYLPVTAHAASSLADFAALAWDTLRDQAERAADHFRAECRAAGVKSGEAVIDESEKAPSLVRHAHCNDLTVLTQADPAVPGHRWAQDLVEQVVLYSARPTLNFPCAGRFDSFGTRIMVAWDDSRESTRAVADALPLLRPAEQVVIVSWNEAGTIENTTLGPRLETLHRWLMWQAVSADVRVETTGIGIAEAILLCAADLSTDLIVMGACGHARWAERVLSEATRGRLVSMAVPALMSH